MRHRIRSYRRLLAMFYVFLFCIRLSPVYAQVFNTVVVDAIGDVGQYTSIALDSDGEPHISYYDATNGDLRCAGVNGGTWITQVVDEPGDVGRYSSIAIDMFNNRYISYYYETNEYLKLAYTEMASGPWQKELGPSVRIVSAKSTSLVLETQATNPIIAFFDDNGRYLKLALFDRADILPPEYKDATGWATEWIQSSQYSMEDVSLVLDNCNEPHLTYIDLTGPTAELKYCEKACFDNGCTTLPSQIQPTGQGDWTFETVDATGSAGKSASISLDANNTPHISYYDAWSRYLKYASKVGGNWVIEIVDDAANVGQHSAIVVNADNNPRISYYDATNGDLKYATKNSGEWFIQTVDDAGDVGLYTSIALDANDNPHISYYDADNGDLKYASLQKERICFPPHRGVPDNNNPPVIDGEVRDDVGWRGAYRLTYGTGTDPAHMAFQALKHNSQPYLYLSFEVRNDPTFDDDDVVVICLRPDANSGSAIDDRRLFIFPVCSPADPGCDLDTLDDDVNRPPRLVEVWRNSDSWTSISQPGGLDVKVRSHPDGSSLAWNLEVKVPTSINAGGQEWIDFSDNFLFYFNVIRVSSPDPTSEFLWPINAPEVNGDIHNYAFSPSEWGVGSRSNTEVCKGVSLKWSDIGTIEDPVSKIKFTTPPPNTITNTFFATVRNNTEINGMYHMVEDIMVRFRMANWGIPGPDDWADIPATNLGCPDLTNKSNPTCPQDIFAAIADDPGLSVFTLKWKVADADIPDYQANPHQCILAEIDSWSDANIVTKSVYRNMDFVNASSFSRSAEISAKGYGPPPEGKTDHEFVLNITTQELEKNNGIPTRGFVDDKSPVSSLRWAAHGYRYSGRSIIIHGTKYNLVDPVGSFGYIVRHEGLVKEWQHQLVGAEMIGTNLYKLSIPAEGVRTITTRIEPQEYGRWTISAHSGAAVPTGTFANDFDPGINALLDAGYHFSPQLSVVAFFGYNDFKSKTAGVDDNYWLNLSANVRYYRPWSGPWSVYIGAGPGIYIPQTGDSEFGANVGLGINYEYSPLLTFEWGADYHTIFDPDIQFVHSHAGVIFRF